MVKDLRAHPRKNVQVNVALYFLEDSPSMVVTRDLSEGGLFMLLDNPRHYPLGELVNIKYKNPLNNHQETEQDAVIVRTDATGIAIAFIDMESF